MADTTVTVGSAGNLVLANKPTRGVTFEVYASWDYTLFANDLDNPGTPVIFRGEQGNYSIEMTSSNYGGYIYWKSGLGANIYLVNDRATATAWTVSPVTNGFRITTGDRTVASHPTDAKRWITTATSEWDDARKYDTFQFSKV